MLYHLKDDSAGSISQTALRCYKLGPAARQSETASFAYSKEAGLLHNTDELFLIHLPISIPVCLINHLLQA